MKSRSLKTFIFLGAFILLYINNSKAQVFYITPGGHFVINGSPSFVVNNASIKNNGTFTPGQGTVYFTGYSDTTVSNVTGDSVTQITNLTINKSANGVAIKSPVWVTNVLAMAQGKLYADSALTLISNISNTARVAAVPSNCSINGKAIVQRFIPARRAWRLLTAPITSSNSIYNSWQNGGVYTVGEGTLITMPNPGAGSGMDAGINANYSMKSFNPATQGLVSVTNTINSNISQGINGSADNTGYYIFVRGDRNPLTVGNPSTVPINSTTLSGSGLLQTGNQVFTAAAVANRYTLIGNPYASPIDFNDVTLNNVIKRFYIWDPTLNQVGGYVVMDDATNSGVFIKSVSASAQTNEIQSGQAFFVQTLATGAASVTVSESSKSTTNNNLVFRPESGTESLNANLSLVNADSSITLIDGAVAQFNSSFSAGVDYLDGVKLSNINEGIGMLAGTTNLSIDRRPLIGSNDTLRLKLTALTANDYQLQFVTQNMLQANLTGVLVDNYLGTSTAINLYGTTTVNFSAIAGVAASSVNSRFMIIFNPIGVLPVTFTSLEASRSGSDISVEWKVENELNILQYDVERSSDGVTFTKVATKAAIGNSSSDLTYDWLDADPIPGDNFYRIRSISTDGKTQYSIIVKVTLGTTDNEVSGITDVYPNPVGMDQALNVQLASLKAGEYKISLVSSSGQTIREKTFTVTDNTNSPLLVIPTAGVAKGSYEVIVKSSTQQYSKSVVVD
jgi:hypothetical protein